MAKKKTAPKKRAPKKKNSRKGKTIIKLPGIPGTRNRDGSRNWNRYYQMKKKLYPVKVWYNNTRQNARKRGIDWQLTYEQYLRLWTAEQIQQKKNGYYWQLDRINSKKGYIPGNCQIIPKSVNNLKAIFEREGKSMPKYIAQRFKTPDQSLKISKKHTDESMNEAPF